MSKFTKKSQLKGLIITRCEGERIVIANGELIIEVVQIKGKQVRLAFAAAQDISIQRQGASEASRETPAAE